MHSFILSTLSAEQSSQRIYFSSGSVDDDYTAIVGLKREKSNNKINQDSAISENVWIVSSWTVDESALSVVYAALDDIVNWETDHFLFYNTNDLLHPHLKSKVKKPIYFYRLDRHVMDVSAALDLKVK